MSNQEENPYFFDEEKREMVLSHDDLVNLRDFYSHFKIEEPQLLKETLDLCIPDSTKFDFEQQLRIRQGLANTIAYADHPLFKLEVFDEIREPNKKISDELQLRFELHKILAEDENQG